MKKLSILLFLFIPLSNALYVGYAARNGWDRLTLVLAVLLLVGGGLCLVRARWGRLAALIGAAVSLLFPAVYLLLHELIGALRELFGAEVHRLHDPLLAVMFGLTEAVAFWPVALVNGLLFGLYGICRKREYARSGGECA